MVTLQKTAAVHMLLICYANNVITKGLSLKIYVLQKTELEKFFEEIDHECLICT